MVNWGHWQGPEASTPSPGKVHSHPFPLPKSEALGHFQSFQQRSRVNMFLPRRVRATHALFVPQAEAKVSHQQNPPEHFADFWIYLLQAGGQRVWDLAGSQGLAHQAARQPPALEPARLPYAGGNGFVCVF